MIDPSICDKCWEKHILAVAVDPSCTVLKWWGCVFPLESDTNLINKDSDVPEECPYRFEQLVAAGMTKTE
jgi:hypothetical protein